VPDNPNLPTFTYIYIQSYYRSFAGYTRTDKAGEWIADILEVLESWPQGSRVTITLCAEQIYV